MVKSQSLSIIFTHKGVPNLQPVILGKHLKQDEKKKKRREKLGSTCDSLEPNGLHRQYS